MSTPSKQAHKGAKAVTSPQPAAAATAPVASGSPSSTAAPSGSPPPMKVARKKAQSNNADGQTSSGAASSCAAASSTPAAAAPKAKAICRQFLNHSTCPNGAECKFSHDPKEIAEVHEKMKAMPCHDHVKGQCSRDNCRYSHDAAVIAAANAANEAKQAEKSKREQEKAKGTAVVSVSSPPILPHTTGPNNAPDLTHLLVQEHISAKRTPRGKGKAHEHLRNKPFIIGVTGGTASGKTTVCDEIRAKLGKHVALLQMDRFYKSLPHNKPASKHNFDIPEAFDWELFVTTLQKLSTGNVVQVPQYSFETHQRLPQLDTFEGADVIIVEGILTLHEKRIRDQFDLKVFIEADSDVRLARRIQRDITERGRTIDGVIDQYLNTVKPAHEQYIQPTCRYSDIIVPHNGPKNGIAIDLLVQHISTEMYKRGVHLKKAEAIAAKKSVARTKAVAKKLAQANGNENGHATHSPAKAH